MSCKFIRLTLLLCRTRIRKEIQAERVFKDYGLPKEKVIELSGRLGTCDYYKRSNQGERQSCRDRELEGKHERRRIGWESK